MTTQPRFITATADIHSGKSLRISLIIPLFRGGAAFQRCLQAVFTADPAPDEIIVVLDGESPEPYPMLENGRLRVIASPRRLGPAYARNLGARIARGDILFFIDADVLIPPDAIARVRHIFAKDSGLSALIGSYDDAPAEKNFLSQYRNLLHHYVHQTSREDASTFWGACGAIRRDIFLAHDGFDARRYHQPAIEDIELGYRLKATGHRIKLCKTLQVKHLKHWNAFTILKTDILQRALPWTMLILERRILQNDLNTDQRARFSVITVFLSLILLSLSPLHASLFVFILPLVAGLFILNYRTYRFFFKHRGIGFTLCAIPWHWLYYGYSGVAFIIGNMVFWLEKLRRRFGNTNIIPQKIQK